MKRDESSVSIAGDKAGSLQGKRSFLYSLAAFIGRIFSLFCFWRWGRRKRDKALEAATVREEGLADQVRQRENQIAFLKSVFESTSDGVVITDLNGKVKMFNKGAVDIFGLDADFAVDTENLFHILSTCMSDTGSGSDGRLINNMLVRDQKIKNMSVGLRNLDTGKITPCLFTLNFVDAPGGDRLAMVAIIKDNSEVEAARALAEERARVDALTGLFNRQYFDDKIVEEYERMMRDMYSSLSLLFLDIDHFGDFNKDYGHQIGDEVLRRVAKVIKDAVRTVDTPARYGGEEFVCILPDTNKAGGLTLAERIREAISDVTVQLKDGREIHVTASVGLSTHKREDRPKVAQDNKVHVKLIIEEANKAMLHAKNTGRNRVCCHKQQTASAS